MVQFLSDIISNEDDEPPPTDVGEGDALILPYGLQSAVYQDLASDYGRLEAGLAVNTDVEVDFTDFGYQQHLPEEADVSTDVSVLDLADLIQRVLDKPQLTFEKAMVDYLLDPPSIERDELFDDRELLNESQKSLISYDRRLMLRRAEEEDRVLQKVLGYSFAKYN